MISKGAVVRETNNIWLSTIFIHGPREYTLLKIKFHKDVNNLRIKCLQHGFCKLICTKWQPNYMNTKQQTNYINTVKDWLNHV